MVTSGDSEKDKFAVFEEWLLENKAEFSQVRTRSMKCTSFPYHQSIYFTNNNQFCDL
jgi:hypothetical protein